MIAPPNPPEHRIVQQPAKRAILAASWYARGLTHPDAMTCASNVHHRGTNLRVRISHLHPWLHIKVTDFGPDLRHPEAAGRSLDVSRGVARKLGFLKRGVAFLEVEVLP